MIDRTTKLRIRRGFKRRQRQLEDIGSQTEANLDRHFFRRLGRLYDVRRFIAAWILLLVLLVTATVMQTRALGDYYLQPHPAPGGKLYQRKPDFRYHRSRQLSLKAAIRRTFNLRQQQSARG
jgi:hypothetical protein